MKFCQLVKAHSEIIKKKDLCNKNKQKVIRIELIDIPEGKC